MNKEFDVSFLGLTGTIDEEVAKAMVKGDGDITKLPSDFEDISTLLIYINEHKGSLVKHGTRRRCRHLPKNWHLGMPMYLLFQIS